MIQPWNCFWLFLLWLWPLIWLCYAMSRNDWVSLLADKSLSSPSNQMDINSGHFSMISNISNYQHIPQTKINLKPGDMLYLPTGQVHHDLIIMNRILTLCLCSWFHQVTSHGELHKAINYWWKPPAWRGKTDPCRWSHPRSMNVMRNDYFPSLSCLSVTWLVLKC